MRSVLKGRLASVSGLYSLIALQEEKDEITREAQGRSDTFHICPSILIYPEEEKYSASHPGPIDSLTVICCSRFWRTSITWPFLITDFGRRSRNWLTETFGPETGNVDCRRSLLITYVDRSIRFSFPEQSAADEECRAGCERPVHHAIHDLRLEMPSVFVRR